MVIRTTGLFFMTLNWSNPVEKVDKFGWISGSIDMLSSYFLIAIAFLQLMCVRSINNSNNIEKNHVICC